MPKKPTRKRQKRPSGPYDHQTNPLNPATQMDDYHTMPSHSPAPWETAAYANYQSAQMMTSMPGYAHSPYAAQMPSSSMPTPALHAPPSMRTPKHIPPSNPATGPWTQEEDEILLDAKQKGMQWSVIHEKFFPLKTGNACRKRHERLLAKKRADWTEAQLEDLAVAYQGMRGKIWTPLADAVGERWEKVEAVCMEQGLKTLKNKASINARRRSSGHTRGYSSSGSSNVRSSNEYEHGSINEEYNDSGLNGIGLGVSRHTRRRSMQAPPANLDNSILRYGGPQYDFS